MNDPDEIKSDGQSRGPSLSRPGSTPQDPFRSGRSSERISLASTTDVKLDRLSPYGTKVPSLSTASQSYLPQRFFHSRRIKKGQAEKPWKTEKDPKDKWITIISVIGIVVGIAAAGAMIWDGYRSAVVHTYKLVLDQDFSTLTELDPKIWTKEVESGGFGYVRPPVSFELPLLSRSHLALVSLT